MNEKPLVHLAIIMDGNRRWAKARQISSYQGHLAGYRKIEEVLGWCREEGIQILTLFAFSTQNWERDQEEVAYLMELFAKALRNELPRLLKENVRVHILGRRQGLRKDLAMAIEAIENQTAHCTGGVLNIALNYDGRTEILDAVNTILQKGIPRGGITEELVTQHLYGGVMPVPELVVRTSGEQRMSGFLTWQTPYSELYFTSVFWPAFSRQDFHEAVDWFHKRQRRFGK